MTTNELKTALEAETTNLREQFRAELHSAEVVIKEMKDGRSWTHGAFNLGAKASNLAELAGKLEAVAMVLRSVEGKV